MRDGRIGVDSFSYHRRFGEVGWWESPSPVRWETADFLDRAAGLEVPTVSLQTLYLGDMGPVAIRRLGADLEARGLRAVLAWGHRCGLDSGRSPMRFEQAMACVGAAADLGVDLMRIVCGDQFAFARPVGARIARLVPMVRRLAERGADLGVSIAIENHADFAIADLLRLVEAVDADNLGVCFDIGNALRVGDDPVAAAKRVVPHVRMVHVKDMIVPPGSRGAPWRRWPTVPLGRGEIPLRDVLDALRPAAAPWYVEMALMHPDFPDEDAAVADSVAYLRGLS